MPENPSRHFKIRLLDRLSFHWCNHYDKFQFQQFLGGRFVRLHALGVTPAEAKHLLDQFKKGDIDLPTTLRAFQSAPIADLGFAQLDTHRALRKGFAEVVFGSGKTPEQVARITAELLNNDDRVLVTRVTAAHFEAVRELVADAQFHAEARCITVTRAERKLNPGIISVISAGTSDLPVAEEAVITAMIMGNEVDRIYDVGVAGLHRILSKIDQLQKANVLIVVAGMEGALPSVVAGLVSRPVIAVPTSVGYGASFGGIAALLGMLNSCGSGVTVVNIDNGFGAGCAAAQINALAAENS